MGPQSQRYGEVFDRGYKHYDGPRLGRMHAIWALTLYSIKRAMGIKKNWTAKVTPFVLYAAVAIPVAVGIGIRAFVEDAEIFDYVGFYGYVFIILGVFVASIAPEMLCGDRRENVLALYFSRAITRIDYLVAKLLGDRAADDDGVTGAGVDLLVRRPAAGGLAAQGDGGSTGRVLGHPRDGNAGCPLSRLSRACWCRRSQIGRALRSV